MSKDPLEELFGPTPDQPQPQPVPARQRLAQEQAERVRTAQLSMEQEPKRTRGGSAAKPWIVVGLVAVLALIASIIVVNIIRGGDEAGPGAGSATEQPTEEQPAQTAPPSEDPDETEAPDDQAPEEDEVPRVDVGDTTAMAITQWGVSGDVSVKFGSTQYRLENGNTELWLDSSLIRQLPCDGNWGAVQTEGGKYEVLRPAERCAAAPELYDELWGLTDAFVQSIRPA